MSFYGKVQNFGSSQNIAGAKGNAVEQGKEALIKKNAEKDLPAVKITNPTSGAKVNQSTATKFQFQVKNIAKVQVLADIPGGFGKVGEPIDTSKQTDFDITFNVPGKRKVKLQGLSADGKPLEQSNPFDIIDIEVVTAEQFAEEQSKTTEETNKQKKIADLQFDRSNLQSQKIALGKKKSALAAAKTKLDEATQVAAGTVSGPLKQFYESRIPAAQDEFDQAEADFLAAGGQIQLDKLEEQIQEVNKKIAQVQFGDSKTVPIATESKIVKKATDPKVVGKKEDIQTTVVTESEETKELLKAIKETESNEAITKSQFNVEKIKEELELAIAGKQQSGKVVIENVQNVNTSRLRSVKRLGKYLEDPIAFMGNYVWNYDILDPTKLVFRYALPQNLITGINKTTIKLIQETVGLLSETTSAIEIGRQALELQEKTGKGSFNSLFDYYFILEFSDKVRLYMEEQFPEKDFTFLENKNAGLNQGSIFKKITPQNDSIPQSSKNIKFFWLWWNQIFYVNTPIFKEKFIFTIDKNNVIPVNCALYFLEKLFSLTSDDNSIQITFNTVKKDVESESSNLIFDSKLFKLDFLGQLTNSNNYTNKVNKPNIGSENIVNVVTSPFFLYNFSNLSKKEQKELTNKKTVKKCKDVKDDKKITSLKLFYKEGNDDILDKNEPETGLGCDTTTAEWKQAENIMFAPTSIDAKIGRVNYKLPYYNKLMIQSKNSIPSDLDIYQQGLGTSNASNVLSYNKSFEGLSSEIILSVINKSKDGILIDQNVQQIFDFNNSNTLVEQYFGRHPNWGPQYIIDKVPFFNPQDTPFFNLVMLPYIGALNAGYRIDKRLINTSKILQSFYVSSNNTYQSLNIYDSQVKYGKSYNYDLSQIISFVDIKYRYKNPKLSVIAQTEFAEQTEDVTQGLFAPTADTDPDALFGTGNIVSKKVVFEFDTYDIIYSNAVELLKANDITSPISYVDLPPAAPYIRVYPQRGINNKVLVSFEKFSQSKIEKKIIPRKFWTEGWQDARDFFIDISKNSPDSFKQLSGGLTISNSEDEMYFANQDVFRVKLFSSKGIKPKDVLELKEQKDINLFTDGFTEELDLEPNNKYYFAAKFVSFTGLESYYSEVYEIELVDDGGAVFPIIKVVELEEKKSRRKEIEFDKKFRIQPSLLQQAPNLDKDDIGYLTPSVFTDPDDTKIKFKVRLTSKSTGRKIDFNVMYRKDFQKQLRDAGPLNLNQVAKDKILISYKSEGEPGSELEILDTTPTPTAGSFEDEILLDTTAEACCKFTTVGKTNLYARQSIEGSVKEKADKFFDLGLAKSPNKTSVKQFAEEIGIAAGVQGIPGLTDISQLNSETGNIFPINFNDPEQVPFLTYVLYLLYTTISQAKVKKVKGNPYLDPETPFTVTGEDLNPAADYLNARRNELFCFLCKRKGTSDQGKFPTPARLIEQFLKNNGFDDFSDNDKYLGGVVDCRKYGFVRADGFGTPKLINSLSTPTDTGDRAFKCNTTIIKKGVEAAIAAVTSGEVSATGGVSLPKLLSINLGEQSSSE